MFDELNYLIDTLSSLIELSSRDKKRKLIPIKNENKSDLNVLSDSKNPNTRIGFLMVKDGLNKLSKFLRIISKSMYFVFYLVL